VVHPNAQTSEAALLLENIVKSSGAFQGNVPPAVSIVELSIGVFGSSATLDRPKSVSIASPLLLTSTLSYV
jgi:hypothetical protein